MSDVITSDTLKPLLHVIIDALSQNDSVAHECKEQVCIEQARHACFNVSQLLKPLASPGTRC